MRSGTTLLADMLGGSPHIAHCPFELKDIWSRVGGVSMASPKTRDLECPECYAENANPEIRERLIAAFEKRKSGLLGKSEKSVFLNKNPHLCNKLGLVTEFFPDSRIIWIHRHLPQVVSSLKKLFIHVYLRQKTRHYWPKQLAGVENRCWSANHFDDVFTGIPPDRIFPGGDVFYLAEYWLESNRAVADFFNKESVSGRIAVSEELLLESPENQIAQIYGFLHLPYYQGEYPNLVRERNDIWRDELNDEDLASLLFFLEKRGQDIDEIFPGEDRALLYLRKLKEAKIKKINE